MLNQVRKVVIFLTLGAAAGVCLAKGDAARGATLNQTCVACHSVDGNSVVPAWPKIAGQHETYIFEQIIEIQKGSAGKRFEPTMLPMVKDLSVQDMHDLAAFYAAGKMSRGEASAENIDRGRDLYRYGDFDKGLASCMSCHGPSGEGNHLAKIPRLGGQHKDFLVLSLKKYKNDERKTDVNGVMRDIAKLMSEEDMQAVSNYISGLYE